MADQSSFEVRSFISQLIHQLIRQIENSNPSDTADALVRGIKLCDGNKQKKSCVLLLWLPAYFIVKIRFQVVLSRNSQTVFTHSLVFTHRYYQRPNQFSGNYVDENAKEFFGVHYGNLRHILLLTL